MINIWLAISDNAQSAIRERLATKGEYTGPVPDKAAKIFRKMADHATVLRLFRKPTLSGKVWNLWSVYIEGSQAAQDAIDYLATEYGTHFQVAGAWDYDTGAQIIAPHPKLLQFMPTIKTFSHDELPTLIGEAEPTVLTDVNLLQGQAPRQFA
jgi:hypothetical protein